MEDPDIWTVNKIISSPANDSRKVRIPLLKHKVGNQEEIARTNSKKSLALTKSFFPPKPQEETAQLREKGKKCCKASCRITHEQVQKQLCKLQPYKAPEPDGIPNVVLTKCKHLIVERLYHIYVAMFKHNLLYKPWKEFTMVVL